MAAAEPLLLVSSTNLSSWTEWGALMPRCQEQIDDRHFRGWGVEGWAWLEELTWDLPQWENRTDSYCQFSCLCPSWHSIKTKYTHTPIYTKMNEEAQEAAPWMRTIYDLNHHTRERYNVKKNNTNRFSNMHKYARICTREIQEACFLLAPDYIFHFIILCAEVRELLSEISLVLCWACNIDKYQMLSLDLKFSS